MGWRAERPAYAALATERGQLMPTFERSLAEFAEHAARHLERPEHGEEEVPASGPSRRRRRAGHRPLGNGPNRRVRHPGRFRGGAATATVRAPLREHR
jgi:hypothetical protein